MSMGTKHTVVPPLVRPLTEATEPMGSVSICSVELPTEHFQTFCYLPDLMLGSHGQYLPLDDVIRSQTSTGLRLL